MWLIGERPTLWCRVVSIPADQSRDVKDGAYLAYLSCLQYCWASSRVGIRTATPWYRDSSSPKPCPIVVGCHLLEEASEESTSSILLKGRRGSWLVWVPWAGCASALQTTDSKVAEISAQELPNPGSTQLVSLQLTLRNILEQPMPEHHNPYVAKSMLQTLSLHMAGDLFSFSHELWLRLKGHKSWKKLFNAESRCLSERSLK